MTATTGRRILPSPRGASLVLRIAAVLLVCLVAGGLTSLGQQYLPDALRSFANSAGGWTIELGAALWLSRLGPLAAAVTGPVGFVLLLQGYAIVSVWRGFPYAGAATSWGVVAVVAGPLVGLGVAWLRSPRRVLALIGALLLVTPPLGEAAYGLTVVGDTTSPAWWIVEAAVAVAIPGALAFAGERRPVREARTIHPRPAPDRVSGGPPPV